MIKVSKVAAFATCVAAALMPSAWAQQATDHDMGGMQMNPADMANMDMSGMNHCDTAAMAMPGMAMPGMTMAMPGALGPYSMAREASGTSWQPDATPMEGMHFALGDWTAMAHGYVNGVYDAQGGPRGGDKAYSASMAMLMAARPVGEDGTVQLRAMLSLDPLMGANGYPLLFATGETANGRAPLVDRMHPHDLFMELSASYSLRLSDAGSVFVYGGLPGEPALGPPVFMHRLSGEDIPEAPITHHWLDSTHVTEGVVTAGYIQGDWKIEGSVFRGREPNQYRYDIETPGLDSASARLSYNPDSHWALQVSWGYLHSPEQLAPTVNEKRTTASASYTTSLGDSLWATTFAWGRKDDRPGRALDGFLLESEFIVAGAHSFFARAERVGEDELFSDVAPGPEPAYTVAKLSVGYVYDMPVAAHLKMGVGGLVSRYAYPGALDRAYGRDPASGMIFARLKVD
jgi:hypothetical protein